MKQYYISLLLYSYSACLISKVYNFNLQSITN